MDGNSTTPKIFAWKEYNFPSGFLTNMILNFAQEWQLLDMTDDAIKLKN